MYIYYFAYFSLLYGVLQPLLYKALRYPIGTFGTVYWDIWYGLLGHLVRFETQKHCPIGTFGTVILILIANKNSILWMKLWIKCG